MVLRQSLLELMKTKPIEKITVKEICEHADINRGTFYTHYSEPRALLEQIQNELYNEIKATLDKYLTDADPASGSIEMVQELIKCIEQNSDICKILLGEHGDSEFLERIIDYAYEKSWEIWNLSMKLKNERLAEYYYSFVSSGSIGAIKLWIQSGMTEPPELLATLIDKLTSQGLKILTQIT